ncbi:hypothetical protein AN993_21535 [Stenotrophomonas maltophilia]|nr:hypothetical protein AN993_21535 [Stenotrophomonas maltophilia]MBA0243843.1 hypothetical protein [Stenotrophomonas maltophilia]MBA0247072.1 hypothetical protein [Stenotrophomonas maltophilia]MBA0307492.1 hypothetical protein [Stenotrophomonas maltophilia]MBA0439695.1 hypothetical protein [Stenotrophomonas maltophilia]
MADHWSVVVLGRATTELEIRIDADSEAAALEILNSMGVAEIQAGGWRTELEEVYGFVEVISPDGSDREDLNWPSPHMRHHLNY